MDRRSSVPALLILAAVAGSCTRFATSDSDVRDAAVEATSPDAGNLAADDDGGDAGSDVDAGGGCPSSCNGGCEDGGCIIVDSTADPLVCPAGLPCTIRCTKTQVCKKAIDCTGSTACNVFCTDNQSCDGAIVTCGEGGCRLACLGFQACNSARLKPADASTVCLECKDQQACNGTQCDAVPTSGQCVGNCASVSNCGSLVVASTGTVLRHFEDQLAKVVALSFFIPLLIGTGGNAGSQTVSTVIRALAVGEVRLADWPRVLLKEVTAGLTLGVLLGVVAFGRAMLWGVSMDLAGCVAVTVLVVCTWANTVGSLIPMAAQRVGIDPTVVSGPLITTLVDASGLFIYLTVAQLMIAQLR